MFVIVRFFWNVLFEMYKVMWLIRKEFLIYIVIVVIIVVLFVLFFMLIDFGIE